MDAIRHGRSGSVRGATFQPRPATHAESRFSPPSRGDDTPGRDLQRHSLNDPAIRNTPRAGVHDNRLYAREKLAGKRSAAGGMQHAFNGVALHAQDHERRQV
jgi:hypothetical protein